MPFSISKLGPYFTSGSISMSAMRSTYRPLNSGVTPSGAISMSQLVRDTNVNSQDPLVPDATENANIPSSRSNIRFSGYRNSIKRYIVTQTGTETNVNLSGAPWNSNLNKNVQKRMNVSGTCGSTNTGSYAASFSATAYNLFIEVTSGAGGILGAGGAGGVVGDNTGKQGGPALFVSSSGSAIRVISRGPIYGGGGGGAKGINGDPGAPGTCFYYTYYDTGNNCGSCPGCGGDTRVGCSDQGGCNCNKKGCRSRRYRSTCRRTVYYSVPGAPGGLGGNGGRGQGYGQSATAGSPGAPGTPGGCPNYGGPGDPGQQGGGGGGYGRSGGSVFRYGRSVSAGGAGRAISGSNYIVDDGSFGGNRGFILGAY